MATKLKDYHLNTLILCLRPAKVVLQYVLYYCGTHIRRVELQAQHSVYNEGGNTGKGGDNAGDAVIGILDVTGPLQFLLLIFP